MSDAAAPPPGDTASVPQPSLMEPPASSTAMTEVADAPLGVNAAPAIVRPESAFNTALKDLMRRDGAHDAIAAHLQTLPPTLERQSSAEEGDEPSEERVELATLLAELLGDDNEAVARAALALLKKVYSSNILVDQETNLLTEFADIIEDAIWAYMDKHMFSAGDPNGAQEDSQQLDEELSPRTPRDGTRTHGDGIRTEVFNAVKDATPDRDFALNMLQALAQDAALAERFLCGSVNEEDAEQAYEDTEAYDRCQLFSEMYKSHKNYSKVWVETLVDHLYQVEGGHELVVDAFCKHKDILQSRQDVRVAMLSSIKAVGSSFKSMDIDVKPLNAEDDADAIAPQRQGSLEKKEKGLRYLVGKEAKEKDPLLYGRVNNFAKSLDAIFKAALGRFRDMMDILSETHAALVILVALDPVIKIVKVGERLLSEQAADLLKTTLKPHAELLDGVTSSLLVWLHDEMESAGDEAVSGDASDEESEAAERILDHVKVSILQLASMCSEEARNSVKQQKMVQKLYEDANLVVKRAALAALTFKDVNGMEDVKYWLHCTSMGSFENMVKTGVFNLEQCDQAEYDGKLATDPHAPLGVWFSAYTNSRKLPKTTPYPQHNREGFSAGMVADVSKLLGTARKGRWCIFFISDRQAIRRQLKYAVVLEGSPEYYWFKASDNACICKTEESERLAFLQQSSKGEWHFHSLDANMRGEDEFDVSLTQTPQNATHQVETSVFFVPPNGRDLILRDNFVSADSIDVEHLHTDENSKLGLIQSQGFCALRVERTSTKEDPRPQALNPESAPGMLWPPKVDKVAELAIDDYNRHHSKKLLGGETFLEQADFGRGYLREVQVSRIMRDNLAALLQDKYEPKYLVVVGYKDKSDFTRGRILADQLLRITSLGYSSLEEDRDFFRKAHILLPGADYVVPNTIRNAEVAKSKQFFLEEIPPKSPPKKRPREEDQDQDVSSMESAEASTDRPKKRRRKPPFDVGKQEKPQGEPPYKRPSGRAPKGMRWNPTTGFWEPIAE